MRFRALVAPIARVNLVTTFALLVSAGTAHADDAREESRAAFRRGVAAIEKQDWATARTELEHAYELYAHPSILLDLGLARARTQAWVLAETALLRFLADDEGAATDEVETARRTLAEVKSHLGTLRVKLTPASAKVTVDGDPLSLGADGTADVRVVLGSHRVRAETDAFVASERMVAITAQGGEAELILVPLPDPTARGPSPLTYVGYSLVGVGAVSLGVGIFAGVRALSLAHEYSTAGEARYQDTDVKSTGIMFRTLSDVTILGGIVLGAAGVVCILVSPKAPRPPPALAYALRAVTVGVPF
ncbi:hypothetical protein BH09MYX1_BH09MYX1_49480 [soil metagenome]